MCDRMGAEPGSRIWNHGLGSGVWDRDFISGLNDFLALSFDLNLSHPSCELHKLHRSQFIVRLCTAYALLMCYSEAESVLKVKATS